LEADFELRKFVAPEFVFGFDARLLVGRYLRNFAAKKVLLVTDKGVMSSGWLEEILHILESDSYDYEIFSKLNSNPRTTDVANGASVYDEEECDVIVALGGGSPMDCAKGIGIVSSNKKSINYFEGVDRVLMPSPPLICIPTTAGSSADVSQFAIISDNSKKVKMAIISKKMVPDVALIDPITTVTLDHEMTISGGFDILSHAIEAYVSNASSPITDIHATEAFKLFSSNMIQTLEHPDNIKFRGNLMLASLHAGLAFSNASLGLIHAMAHSLGGYKDLAHGECNALLLEHVIDFNYDYEPIKYSQMAKNLGMGNIKHKNELLDGISKFKIESGLDHTLKDLGIREEDIPKLSIRAMNDPCMATNPVIPEISEVEDIFKHAL
jgi:alcohol dehydrogenase